MPLIPNYAVGHEKAGQTKALDDHTPGELIGRALEIAREQQMRSEMGRPVSKAALDEASVLLEKAGVHPNLTEAKEQIAGIRIGIDETASIRAAKGK